MSFLFLNNLLKTFFKLCQGQTFNLYVKKLNLLFTNTNKNDTIFLITRTVFSKHINLKLFKKKKAVKFF